MSGKYFPMERLDVIGGTRRYLIKSEPLNGGLETGRYAKALEPTKTL